ncbi:capsular polysaccharide synthesis protein [Empedobacter falsenii]
MIKFLNKILYKNKTILNCPTNDDIKFYGNKKNENFKTNFPKIIWSYWHDENTPPLVEICINSWKKNNPDFEINILNKKNINQYIDTSGFEKYQNLSIANFSDIIRLKLLYQYGGVWLDSSILLNQDIKYYTNILEQKALNLLCFEGYGHLNDNIGKPITESWFLICFPKQELIQDWLFCLQEAFNTENPEQYFIENYPKEYYSIEEKNRNYLSVYMASLVAMKDVNDFKIGLLNSKKNGFYYNYLFKNNYVKIAKYLLLQTKFSKFPSIVKLTSNNRNAITEMLNYNCIRKKSMFGQYKNIN